MIIMQNESITSKEIGLHFYNKYAEQAILDLIHQKTGTHALTFDHFPPSNIDIAITDCLPPVTAAGHKFRTHQLILFLGSSASKSRLSDKKIKFIHWRTPLKILASQLSGEHLNMYLECNLNTPHSPLSMREQMVINHLKNRGQYGAINTMVARKDHKKYSYCIRNIIKKMGFDNKLQLYKWILEL